MKSPTTLLITFWALGVGSTSQFAMPLAHSDEGVDGVTAVASRVSADYVRARASGGSYVQEAYAFGEGGHFGGSLYDDTIDKLKFTNIAHVIAPFLTRQNYLPGRDPGKTKLLIMVYWGLTATPSPLSGSIAADNLTLAQNAVSEANSINSSINAKSPLTASVGFHSLSSGSSGNTSGVRNDQLSAISSAMTTMNMLNDQRDLIDFRNATMLGYDASQLVGTEQGHYARGTAFDVDRSDIVGEIEENRYFVVLMAYDFQLLWKQKQHKLLWETRFSISERRNQFDKALPVMVKYASQYFGQPTDGLVRTRVLDGRVDIGELRSLGEVEEPKK
jgi:hypothetical protein